MNNFIPITTNKLIQTQIVKINTIFKIRSKIPNSKFSYFKFLYYLEEIMNYIYNVLMFNIDYKMMFLLGNCL